MLRKITCCFFSGGDGAGGLIENKFIEFVTAMIAKSKVASQGRYSDNVELPPMSSYSIQMAQTLTVLFTCLMNCEQGFYANVQKF